MADVLKFSIPGKQEYVQMVRLAIASIAGKANFNVEAVEDIKEAVSEACKIVFCHGKLGFSDRYEIICEVEEDSITITASDACHDVKHVDEDFSCSQCPNEGKLAVSVMESLMDDVKVEFNLGGNKIIKMVKNK